MLKDYAEVKPLGENTCLVKKGETLYIRKKVSPELFGIYDGLKGTQFPNLPFVHEVIAYPDFTAVILSYAEGEALSDILEREKTLPLSEVKRIVKGVAAALNVLHKRNCVHRDVNPNNIIVSHESVTLIDLDISRTVKSGACRDTQILGTAGYAAPEQFGFSQTDPRADIFALGVLSNVLLTGHMPYEGIAPGAPGRAIRRAVSIDPRERYGSVRDFCRAFTGAPGEDDAFLIRAVRSIPGFRSLSAPKMAVAFLFYATYIPLFVLFFAWSCTDSVTALKMLFSELLLFIAPYYLLLFKKRSPAVIMLSALSFFSGAALCATILSEIL